MAGILRVEKHDDRLCFRNPGLLKTEGQRNTMYYMIGDAYQANSEVVNKALAIGLQKMKEDGEI